MEQSPISQTTYRHEPPRFTEKAKAAFEAGRVEEAIAIYERAVSQGHKSAQTYKTLGEMYLWINDYKKALQWLQKAQESKPASAELLEHITLSLVSLGRLDDAVEEVNKSLHSQPDIQIKNGSLTEALFVTNCSEDNLNLAPKTARQDHCRIDAMSLIADVLFKARQYSIAEEWYKRILKHKSDALVYAKLAYICRFAERLSEAAEYQRKAVELSPRNGEYLISLGNLLISLGKIPEGVSLSRKAVEKEPGKTTVHSSFLANLHYLPELDPQMLFEEHKRWGQVHAPPAKAKTSHKNIPDPDRRLRVGYISADFRMHPVVCFFEPLLNGHDRKTVEVYGYGNAISPDEMTEQLRKKFDHYRNIRGIDDEQVVHLIEQDKIDILVDLSGHTSDNRLTALSYKPAPIQVTYLGYPDTTGMKTIDYRFTDNLLDPVQLQKFYTEELVYLPRGHFCYNPPQFAPPVSPLPAEQNGFITFGSFNNSVKVNKYILSLWAEILKANSNSRLLLKFKGGDDRELKDRVLNRFEQFDISKDRIEIHGWRSLLEHMQLYNRVDIGLDTYPYHGTTTTCEALWMGVPVVSLVGNHHVSRVGLSLLTRVGLEFSAALTPKEYVNKATALAQNLTSLAKIRDSMRQRIISSGLCDAKAFARSVESAYRKMWHRWCQSVDSRPRPSKQAREDFSKNDVLEFFISENSPLQFVVSKQGMPAALLQAAAEVETGHIHEATALINDETVEAVRKMVSNDPSRTDAMFLLAAILSKIGQSQKAEQWYKEILKHQPHPLVFFELASICRNTGRLSEALQYQRKAVELSPDSHELRTTLAEYLIRMGRTEEGMEIIRKAVEQTPDKVNHSKFLWHLHQLPQLDQQMLFEEHKRWGRIHAPINRAKTSHSNAPEPDRRLRIGYISPDFCGHSVAFFFESLLDAHNREVVEVYGYANVPAPDTITERLKPEFDCYRNIFGLKDKAVVAMIERDKIDILVDLAGHTSDNRLGVMACKPAPIQVTYLGFPDTTGMQQIDYRLTDELADPPQSQRFYTEELVFLPDGFLCYKPPSFAPPVTGPPVLEKGYFTFGSFNNNCKIQPNIIEIWAQILKAKENSRLLLKFGGGDDPTIKDYYLGRFERLGIAGDRIQIHGRKPTVEHLKLYGQVDIALDTYPYNGTTTTCEAMWMGVPTISLVGKAHASRVGLSILSRVGLEIFAAETPSEYVAKAVSFAGEPENLAKIRTSLRAMMFNSPLCDAAGFTRNLEETYRKMWHKWCQNHDSAVSTVCSSLLTQTTADSSGGI